MAATQTGCAAAPPDGASQAADEPARPILPVATRREVRTYARRLMLRHPGRLATALALHGVAATAGLISPRLIGNLVQEVGNGQLTTPTCGPGRGHHRRPDHVSGGGPAMRGLLLDTAG